MDKHYAENIRSKFPDAVKDLFKREQSELCPFVQQLLSESVPGHPTFEQNYAELENYYKSIATPSAQNPTPAYEVYSSGGGSMKFAFNSGGMQPNPSDITDFFMSFARGAQFVADEYKENPSIKQIMVVSPERYELIRGRKAINPNDNAMCYLKKWQYKPSAEEAPVILENTLVISAGYIYDAKVRWAKNIATRIQESQKSAALGMLKQQDVLTCAGIEECDHAHWLEDQGRFKAKFGLSMEEYAKSRSERTNYDTDPLEDSANALKHKAKRTLRFNEITLS